MIHARWRVIKPPAAMVAPAARAEMGALAATALRESGRLPEPTVAMAARAALAAKAGTPSSGKVAAFLSRPEAP